jgi:hypothetical protein
MGKGVKRKPKRIGSFLKSSVISPGRFALAVRGFLLLSTIFDVPLFKPPTYAGNNTRNYHHCPYCNGSYRAASVAHIPCHTNASRMEDCCICSAGYPFASVAPW